MRPRTRQALNISSYVIIMFLLTGFQTSAWALTLPSIPAPIMWLPILIYFALFRNRWEGIVVTYGSAIVLGPFTSMSFSMFSLIGLALLFLGRFFKTRIFWPGASYFMVMCAGAVPVMYLLHLIFSRMAEGNPQSNFPFFMTLVQASLTPPIGALIMIASSRFDKYSMPDYINPTEAVL